MGALDGRVVVVTGAAGRLGQAVCRAVLAEGGAAFALVRTPEQAAALSAPPPGSPFAAHAADLTDEAAVEAAWDAAEARLGPVWAVVNAAGGWKGGKRLEKTELGTFEAMVAVNLRTCFLSCRAAVRRLPAHGGGRIVNVAAWSAVGGSAAGSAAYAATKAAVVGFTRALAEEGRRHAITANCLAPDTLDTPENRAAMPDADPRRWVPLEEAAAVVLGCLRPEAASLNGAVLPLPPRG